MVLQDNNSSELNTKPTPVQNISPSYSTRTLVLEEAIASQILLNNTNDQTITNIPQLERDLQLVTDTLSVADSLPVSESSQTQWNPSHQSDIIQEELSQDIKLEDAPVPEVIYIKEEIPEIPPIIGDMYTATSRVLYPDKPHQLKNLVTDNPLSVAVSSDSIAGPLTEMSDMWVY